MSVSVVKLTCVTVSMISTKHYIVSVSVVKLTRVTVSMISTKQYI